MAYVLSEMRKAKIAAMTAEQKVKTFRDVMGKWFMGEEEITPDKANMHYLTMREIVDPVGLRALKLLQVLFEDVQRARTLKYDKRVDRLQWVVAQHYGQGDEYEDEPREFSDLFYELIDLPVQPARVARVARVCPGAPKKTKRVRVVEIE